MIPSCISAYVPAYTYIHLYSPFHFPSCLPPLSLSPPSSRASSPGFLPAPFPPGPGAANRSILLAAAKPPLAKAAFPDSAAQCANASSDNIENRYSVSLVVNPDRFECGDGVRTEERPPRLARRISPSNRLHLTLFDGANHFRSMAGRPWTRRTRRPS